MPIEITLKLRIFFLIFLANSSTLTRKPLVAINFQGEHLQKIFSLLGDFVSALFSSIDVASSAFLA